MIEVKLYSRDDCHLCEQAKSDLESIKATLPHRLIIVDVDDDPFLSKEYGFEVPVVEVGPYKLKAPFGLQELQMTLAAAHDRVRHIEMVERSPALEAIRQSGVWTGVDRFNYWISRHYIAMFNLLIVVYLGFSFLAAVLMKVGAQDPANLVYRAYSLVCHQLAYRSFFLFGEQPYYPRQAAGVEGVVPYGEATGLGEGSTPREILAARNFVGNEQLGYKVALCQRDVAIYASIILFSLVFVASNRKLPPLPWYLWIAFGMVPIALDGLTQLLSQPPFELWAFRESTPFLRLLTGGLFGFMTAWFGYPVVEQTMSETRQIMSAKWNRTHQIAR
jgi:uncharacterized membrane protein